MYSLFLLCCSAWICIGQFPISLRKGKCMCVCVHVCVYVCERGWDIESLKLWEIYVNILKYIILSRNDLFFILSSLSFFLNLFYLLVSLVLLPEIFLKIYKVNEMFGEVLYFFIYLYSINILFLVSVERAERYEVVCER